MKTVPFVVSIASTRVLTPEQEKQAQIMVVHCKYCGMIMHGMSALVNEDDDIVCSHCAKGD